MAWTVERVAEHLSIDAQTAETVIGIVRGTVDPFTIPAVATWRDQCYHEPKVNPEVRMKALDAILKTYGTEAIWGNSATQPVAEYCNTGDSYGSTVLYDYSRGRYLLTTWGDWVEQFGDKLGVQ